MTNDAAINASQPSGPTVRALLVPDDVNQPLEIKDVAATGEDLSLLINAWLVQSVDGDGWTAWVDESGMIQRRPINVRATQLAMHLQRERGNPATGPLHGPVVFCGDTGADGVESDVLDHVVTAARVVDALVAGATDRN